MDQLISISNLLNNYSVNFLFIGGDLNTQKITHYTIKKLGKLNEQRIIPCSYLLDFLDSKKREVFFLKNLFLSFVLTQLLNLKN